MLKKLNLKNFTVFSNVELNLSPNLNIIIGENGQGKSHILKIVYSSIALSFEQGKKTLEPSKLMLQKAYADKIVSVFRSETLGRLVKRKQGRDRCEISLFFDEQGQDVSFSFSTSSKTDVQLDKMNKKWQSESPVFFPTRELLTLYPNFSSVYKNNYLEFEETYYDTCILLGGLVSKGKKEEKAKSILSILEEAMGGKIVLDKNGRFYLSMPGKGTMEIPLVAEGLRKLAMVARLVATGSLIDKGYLFWDEPEANLNPKLVKLIARVILLLCNNGIQVFIATHSLFLLKELEILGKEKEFKKVDKRFFGLKSSEDAIVVEQGGSIDDIVTLTLLDEELAQSERFLEL